MPTLLEDYTKWRDELSAHLKKLRDILTVGGMPTETVDETLGDFLENITTLIGDLTTSIRDYVEAEAEEGEEESFL